MSTRHHDRLGSRARRAVVFAALGDPTRLMLVARLGEGVPLSITRLTERSALTRQAISKHLAVLRQAGIVRGIRKGRESLFALEPAPIDEARTALDRLSRQWDVALAKLKAHVER